ncbi:hypothetical protein B0H13DRAFT_1850240 [Mycena leptocephala]|nr:hypothetical protein B0H13DRAFT_1850240 [Mycena leptocephala]
MCHVFHACTTKAGPGSKSRRAGTTLKYILYSWSHWAYMHLQVHSVEGYRYGGARCPGSSGQFVVIQIHLSGSTPLNHPSSFLHYRAQTQEEIGPEEVSGLKRRHRCSLGSRASAKEAEAAKTLRKAMIVAPMCSTLRCTFNEHHCSRPIAPIFMRGKPVGIVAGSCRPSPRRSPRASRPSACAIDSNNAEASTGSLKRKSAPTNPESVRRKAARPSELANADSGDDVSDNDSAASSTAGDTEADDDAMAVDSEEYKSIKAMADADYAYTIFHRVKNHKNPDTGVIQDGAICLVCTHDGVRASTCFLTGSVTTLHQHIARHENHFKIHKARCAQLGIEMNERATLLL